MPGAIATPRYSRAAEIAMKTVAVPKLTTISGAPKRSRPPIAAATRSAPTSAGFSVTTGISRCVCGVRKTGVVPKNRVQTLSRIGSSFGTTLAITTVRIAASSTFPVAKSCVKKTPYSSGVRRSSVVTRHVCVSRIPGKTSELRFGVADVDRQEHCINSSIPSSSRAASVAFSARPSSLRPVSPHSSTSSF